MSVELLMLVLMSLPLLWSSLIPAPLLLLLLP
jgi:hypothetical protein